MNKEALRVLRGLGFDSLTPEAVFMLEPLCDGWRPISFAEYWTIRRRQWLLTQIDSAILKGRSKQRDIATGQGDMFA